MDTLARFAHVLDAGDGSEMPPEIRGAVSAALKEPGVTRMRKALTLYKKDNPEFKILRSGLAMVAIDVADAAAASMAVGAPERAAAAQIPDILGRNRVPFDFVEDVEEFLSVFWRALKRHMPEGFGNEVAILKQLMR
jgi:hypothetical protein